MKAFSILFKVLFLFTAIFCSSAEVSAHLTPNTVMIMDISPGRVAMELQIPLPELELSFGNDITKFPDRLTDSLGPQLKEYFIAHIHPYITRENPWRVEIKDMEVGSAQQSQSGPPYREITVHLVFIAPADVSTRKFTLDYDVILHQVVTHKVLVSIRNDWETGKAGAEPEDVGVLQWDTHDNKLYPLEINAGSKGNWWTGFTGMVSLGKDHIAEGTDHLLFLLVLLLPAPLIARGKRWTMFGGTRYSVVRLLKIVTAFTVGHSLTLILGALGWIHIPSQPIEVLIAFSILVSACHAISPLFPGKEMFIAGGFGLIHGLAFASTLVSLNLQAGPLALSILGFNIGIELMQLFVIAMIVPWLILLSQTPIYKYVRILGAAFAGIAALAWIAERVSGSENFISPYLVNLQKAGIWVVICLAVLSCLAFFGTRNKPQSIHSVL